MIKTMKVKKKMRLDELIKYAWDNQLNKIFVSDKGLKNIGITIDSIDLRCLDNGIVTRNDSFTVEVEEQRPEDRVSRWTAEGKEERLWTQMDGSINDVKDNMYKSMYALIDGKLELIWEAENDEQ